jgi:hypothetical protein
LYRVCFYKRKVMQTFFFCEQFPEHNKFRLPAKRFKKGLGLNRIKIG